MNRKMTLLWNVVWDFCMEFCMKFSECNSLEGITLGRKVFLSWEIAYAKMQLQRGRLTGHQRGGML